MKLCDVCSQVVSLNFKLLCECKKHVFCSLQCRTKYISIGLVHVCHKKRMARIYGRCTEEQFRAMETEFALTSWCTAPRSTFLCRCCGGSAVCFYISETYPICFDCLANRHDMHAPDQPDAAKPNELGLTIQQPSAYEDKDLVDKDFLLL